MTHDETGSPRLPRELDELLRGLSDDEAAELYDATAPEPVDPRAQEDARRRLAEREPRLQVDFARRWIASGRFEDARRAASRAVELAPGDACARLLLGYAAWKLGRLDEARDSANRARLLGAPLAASFPAEGLDRLYERFGRELDPTP